MNSQTFSVLLFFSLACIWSRVVAEARAELTGGSTSANYYAKNVTAGSRSGANVTCFRASLARTAKKHIQEALRSGKLVEITNIMEPGWTDPTETIKISAKTDLEDDVVRLDKNDYGFAFDEIEAVCGEQLPSSGKEGKQLTRGATNIWHGTLQEIKMTIYLNALNLPSSRPQADSS